MWFSAKANPSAKMASTISVGLPRMASDILFMPRPWRSFGKRKTTFSEIRWKSIKAEARYVTLNDVFTLWAKVKRGLKDNTFQNYLYLYRQFVEPDFGKSKVSALKKSDVKQFYNTLADERGLQISTIDSVHTVLHQVLDMAVDDCYLREQSLGQCAAGAEKGTSV